MSLATAPVPPATPDWREEWLLCAANPAFFIDTYGEIDDTQGASGMGGRVRFRLWPGQVQVIRTLRAERQIIVLKARQLGISWLVCAYVLWRALFQPGQDIFLFSRGKKEAKELLRRVRALYDRLPAAFHAILPALEAGNKEELVWAHGSRVQSMASTPGSGVSFTASLVVMDEAARMTWGEELFGNVLPTVEHGGQLILVSTAHGVENYFHTLWDQSVRGQNRFARVFLPWWSRPGRTQAWYRRVLADATDPRTTPQDYPANDLEAFLASGRTRFEPVWVAAQAVHVRELIPRREWPEALRVRHGWAGLEPGFLPAVLDDVPGLKVYRAPEPGRSYVVAADVAEGREPTAGRDPDYDAAVVLDADSWEEMASLHGRWEPDEYAKGLMALSEPYGATVIVERNAVGLAVLATFRLARFPRIGLGEDGYQGWPTNVRTKPQMIALLAAALRDGLIAVRTAVALGEMHAYRVLKDGATGAPASAHDDFVMAWAIGLAYLRAAAGRPEYRPPVAAGPSFKVPGVLAIG